MFSYNFCKFWEKYSKWQSLMPDSIKCGIQLKYLPEAASRGVLWKRLSLKTFTIFTTKHLHSSLFLIKKACDFTKVGCFWESTVLPRYKILKVTLFMTPSNIYIDIFFKYVSFMFLKTFRGNNLKRVTLGNQGIREPYLRL